MNAVVYDVKTDDSGAWVRTAERSLCIRKAPRVVRRDDRRERRARTQTLIGLGVILGMILMAGAVWGIWGMVG